MLKTNSRQARANIRFYITENATDYAQEFNPTATTFEDIAKVLYNDFLTRAYNTPWERTQNRQSQFENFAQGLPWNGTFDYYLCKAVDTLGDILEETETERNRYTETQAEQMLTRLIYREIINAVG